MADQFNYNSGGSERNGWESFTPWIPTLIMLFCLPPVGLVMLLLKFFGQSEQRRATSSHPYDEARAAEERARWEAQSAARGAKNQARQATEEVKSVIRDQVRQATEEAKNAGRRAAEEAKNAARQATEQAKNAARHVTAEPWNVGRQATQKGKAAPHGATPPPRATKKANPLKRDKRDWKLRRKADEGRGLAIGGGVLAAIFGLASITQFLDELSSISAVGLLPILADLFVPMGFCGGGLVMMYYGLNTLNKSKRYRKYLALIGKRSSIAVDSLASAMGVSDRRACDDLQDMLDAGHFPMGFLDLGSGRLYLDDQGLRDDPAEATEAEPAQEAPPRGMERENVALSEIRQLNEAIADEAMSRKIDRIGEITGKIFAYLREKPDREGQLRSFLSYYLPTTLKILRAYAQMESQGIEGSNITAAKERIEGMMDKVVDGFEKQLDRLFQDDAMDITTDVAVLERMLDKDGLGGGEGLRLGG